MKYAGTAWDHTTAYLNIYRRVIIYPLVGNAGRLACEVESTSTSQASGRLSAMKIFYVNIICAIRFAFWAKFDYVGDPLQMRRRPTGTDRRTQPAIRLYHSMGFLVTLFLPLLLKCSADIKNIYHKVRAVSLPKNCQMRRFEWLNEITNTTC